MDLWQVEPSHRRTIATWIGRKPSASAAIADQFLAARLALAQLSVNIPSAAQSRLGVDLSALKELVNRTPEPSPAEAEKIQAQWTRAEALVIGEYGLDDRSQPLAAPLDHGSPTSIAVRELEVRILWWVSVLSNRTLPHQDQSFPGDGIQTGVCKSREGCAVPAALPRRIDCIEGCRLEMKPVGEHECRPSGRER